MTPAERVRNSELKKKYGITLADYDRIHAEQGGKCAICEKECPPRGHDGLHVDHCHLSGRRRKLLCPKCNRGLGFIEDVEWVSRAQSYLLGFQWTMNLGTKQLANGRFRGSGCVYRQRGSRFWWLQWYVNGKYYRTSSKTEDKNLAIERLKYMTNSARLAAPEKRDSNNLQPS